VHLCTEDKGLYVIECGDGPLFFFSKYKYEHGCIFKNFIVGLLADSVMLPDTLYANISETVELRCPYTSHDLQLQWRGPPYLTVLSFGKDIKTSLENYDRLELYGNHDNGELNLKITNLTSSDEGEYRFILIVNGFAIQSSIHVYIRSK
jgi:hypothetical protein